MLVSAKMIPEEAFAHAPPVPKGIHVAFCRTVLSTVDEHTNQICWQNAMNKESSLNKTSDYLRVNQPSLMNSLTSKAPGNHTMGLLSVIAFADQQCLPRLSGGVRAFMRQSPPSNLGSGAQWWSLNGSNFRFSLSFPASPRDLNNTACTKQS
jgi:hypothetical protein